MSPDQYATAKKVFLEACAKPGDQRYSFLLKACGGDKQLLQHVERLLAHHLPESPRAQSAAVPVEKSDRLGISDLPSFQTGDIVADRYRIVSLLGEGAMGRVYRADDTRLNQSVALKFLPRLHILDPAWRRRVESEVKLSREVAHPNICRVYDLGEVNGSPFISMEFVDGENLATLLRRVGRLTGARAIEIARQLCAGLAAAHIRGVLHRDLKPANVLIDQEGRVRITDFGLAVMTGHVERGEIRAGTPRYMAPEQLAGIAVNEKSDIYSLGLVLYEMFTGRPAFDAHDAQGYLRLHQSVRPTIPTEIVPTIDPKVEAVILACLQKDPALRPESALNVTAALPGGDLLAAALDAGQIPTREMLARAAAEGKINPAALKWVAIATLILFFLAILVGRNTHPIAKGNGAKSPDVLLERAQEIRRLAGYHVAPSSFDAHFLLPGDLQPTPFQINAGWMGWASDTLLYLYRDCAIGSFPDRGLGFPFVTLAEAPFTCQAATEGLVILTDGQGRLLYLQADITSGANGEGSNADWQALIDAAGINRDDDRRLNVATDKKTVQHFSVNPESASAGDLINRSNETRRTFVSVTRNCVFLLLLVVAMPAAWKNGKKGGDLSGAVWLGVAVTILRLVANLLTTRFLGGFAESIEGIALAVAASLCEGMIIAIFYLALESHARRLWPRALGSWSRLLAGRFRDPFVGRDVLIGCLVGNFWAILTMLDRRIPAWFGWETREQARLAGGLDDLLGARFALGGIIDSAIYGLYQGLILLLVLVIATWLAGARRWLVLLLAWLVTAAMYAPNATHPVTAWALLAVGGVGSAIYLLTQFGLVSLLAALLVAGLLAVFPITTDFTSWYAGYGLFAALLTVGLGIAGLVESRRPLEPKPRLQNAA